MCYIEEPPPPPIQQQSEPQQFNYVPSTVVVPQSDLSPPAMPLPLAPISPREEGLGMMADKKRRKWMREKGKKSFENQSKVFTYLAAEMDRMRLEVEYDQLKHQLSPIHKKASSSPGMNSTTNDANHSFLI